MSSIPDITLNDGTQIPQFGLGTWQIPDNEAADAVRHALELGYRHIDTAAIYKNERGVGAGIAAAGLPREQLYVTTKLWNQDQGYDSALRACEESLKRLGLDHVNLYLIHWPCPDQGKFLDAWKAMIRLREEGLVTSIGVSNFRPDDAEVLIMETGVVPAVNQIEVHPFFQQKEMRDFNRYKGIATQAWSPLARGGDLLPHPTIQALAQKHGKTPAQVVLRWHIELGSIVFPKSVHPERIRENLDVFDFRLDADDLLRIAELDEGRRTGPDPSTFS
ncbi:aldo/keto reductase [Pseudomonas kuykendallii]|uniref:2,5-diketo-D-gluconate reductase A n=1 Tax=Pseudomonas kuykendallii TaxID=1007099 RepID=A0A1H2SAW0_9PSED|nr:aldo/keto reductase [Pseudomonas kuykendallii]MCQ4270474.1 aldo/keto reductase [Pseudomonas kuykendallii]SDW28677.1 2,5-diketo-D-gluconate reductase A [Pseudomonas kuykendallii]